MVGITGDSGNGWYFGGKHYDSVGLLLMDLNTELHKKDLQIEQREGRLRANVNANCTCGGSGPGEGCRWCDLYHYVLNTKVKRVDETLVHKDCAHGEIMVIHKCAECGEKIEFV